MSGAGGGELPAEWVRAELPEIARLNPPLDRCLISDSVSVDFVPMRAVEPEGGGLRRPEISAYGTVKKGYTAFLPGDVIMAKITPCMENGKTCVVPDLPGAACFGSTEFHVVRTEPGIDARWIANFLLQHSTRHAAHRQMMGGVGQMRVPAAFLESLKLLVPPHSEQQRILDSLDELLSDLDAGVAGLERVRAKLKHYRAVILKAAVEGAFTAEWRKEHPDTEPAPELLKQILIERRRCWEEVQLQKFKEAGKTPPKDWKEKYKEPVALDASKLPSLPGGWCWTYVDQLRVSPIINGISIRGCQTPPGIAALRLNAMSENGFDYSQRRYLPLKPSDVDDLWIREGDFFVSRGNGSKKLVGRGTQAQEPNENIIFPDLMMRLRFAAFLRKTRWIPLTWGSLVIRNQIEKAAKTTAGIWKISQPDLARALVPLPPMEEQAHIVEAVEEQLSVIDHLEADLKAKLKTAQALRQSILRQAFQGKLVPQDPTDEPASELLKRIAAEREERARHAATVKQAKPKQKPQRKRAA